VSLMRLSLGRVADVMLRPDAARDVRMIHPDRMETERDELLTSDEVGQPADRFDDTHVRLLLDVAVEHYLHGHEDRA
jgi:hypothetical protein